MKKVALYR